MKLIAAIQGFSITFDIMTSVIYYSGFVLSAFLNLFGVRIEENPAYQVLLAEGSYEVREYAPVVVARTVVEGDYKQASGEGFRRLVGYITGDNMAQEKLAMTTPVTVQNNEPPSEKISMTAPVTVQQQGNRWQMEFILPKKITLETAPRPTKANIELAQKPATTIATLRFSGSLSPEQAEKKITELKAWLASKGYALRGEAYAAGYDSPFTPSFLRRNEVHVAVDFRKS